MSTTKLIANLIRVNDICKHNTNNLSDHLLVEFKILIRNPYSSPPLDKRGIFCIL